MSEAILQRIPHPPWSAACGTDEVKSIALQLHASNHGTEETHTSSATQVGMASEKPSHHVRCWTNDGHTCVSLLTDGCASSVRKELSLALLPLPQSTPLAPSSSLPPSVFCSTSCFFCLSSAGGLILATQLVPSTEITVEKMT